MLEYGFLIVNKPVGITSFDVIHYLRKVTGIRKIGHVGTLDPFAEGVLIIGIGNATRLIELFNESVKSYDVVAELFKRTDTGDITGSILEQRDLSTIRIPTLDLESYVLNLKEQTPPFYSAIKVNGKRSYALARQGIMSQLPKRNIEITEFQVLDYHEPYLSYRCTVSKGTYIRSLTETIGEYLGTIATTSSLTRTAVGKIKLSSSVPMKELDTDNWKKYLLPAEEILPGFPRIELQSDLSHRFQNGLKIELDESAEGIYLVYEKNILIGLGRIKSSMLHPYKVLR